LQISIDPVAARGALPAERVMTWVTTFAFTNLTVAAPWAASFTVAVAVLSDELTRAALASIIRAISA
jgi:hypothetical protein